MKDSRLLKFVFVALIVFNSCTVEKRTFRSGYYVNWKGGEEVISNETVKLVNETSALSTPICNINADNLIRNTVTSKQEKPTLKPEILELSNKKTSIVKTQFTNEISSTNSYDVEDKDDKPRRRMNWVGLGSLLFLFLGPLALLSIPMAIFAIKQFKKNPEKYYGIWAPTLALVIVLALFFIAALFIIESAAATAALGVLTILGLITLTMLLYFILG